MLAPTPPASPEGKLVATETWQAQLLHHRDQLHSFLSRWLDDDRSMYENALDDEKSLATCTLLDTTPGRQDVFELSLNGPNDVLLPIPSELDLSAAHSDLSLEQFPEVEDGSDNEKPADPKTPKGSKATHATFTSVLSIHTERSGFGQDSKPLRSSLFNRTHRSLAARQMREEFKAVMMAAEDTVVTDFTGPPQVVRLATSQWFVNFGMVAIFSNAVYMIWGESIPLGNQIHYRQGLFIGDILFLLVFGFELAVQWVARGLCRFFTTKGWQLRCVELLVVAEQAFSLLVESADSSFVRATRLLRAARFSRILRVARFVRLLQLLLASSQYRLMSKSIQILPQTAAISACILYLTVQVFALMISMQVRAFLEESEDAGHHEFLLKHFGSVLPSVSSLWSVMTLGKNWEQMADELLKVSALCFMSFQLYIFIFMFIITNLIRALFIQNTMTSMNIAKTFDIRTLMNRKQVFVSDLKEAFGRDALEYDDVSGQLEATRASKVQGGGVLEDPQQLALSRFSKVTQLASTDLDNIIYCLSDAGTQIVPIEEFVTSCIGQMDAATKADLQSLSMRQMQLQAAFRRAKMAEEAQPAMMGAMDSLSTTTNLQELRIIVTTEAELADEVATLYDNRFPFEDSGIQSFLNTLRCAIEAAQQAKGGSGFIVGTAAAYKKLKQRRIRMEPSDISEEYRKGYMTYLLEHRHVGDDTFLQAIRDFSDHSLEEGDRWPTGHEAAGLPKDGYMLLSHAGICRMGAAKLSGCPKSRCVWRGVGTRHQTGLGICEVLAGELAAVIIVSDSGRITVLCPFGIPLGVQTGKPPQTPGSTFGDILQGWSKTSGWFSETSAPS